VTTRAPDLQASAPQRATGILASRQSIVPGERGATVVAAAAPHARRRPRERRRVPVGVRALRGIDAASIR